MQVRDIVIEATQMDLCPGPLLVSKAEQAWERAGRKADNISAVIIHLQPDSMLCAKHTGQV